MMGPSNYGGGHYIFCKMTGIDSPGNPDDTSDVAVLARKNKWMIVDSCNFGARRSGDASSARASYFDVPFSKQSCPATGKLIEFCSSGFKKGQIAQFFFYTDDVATKKAVDHPIMTLKLLNVTVIAVDVGSDTTDHVSLSYESFEWEIHGQRAADKVG